MPSILTRLKRPSKSAPPKVSGADNELVFVYGTLKAGLRNHYLLQHGGYHNASLAFGVSLLSNQARTIDRFPLVVMNNLPMLFEFRSHGQRIKGELYSVPPAILRRLDALEGHPGLYQRKQKDVVLPNGDEKSAWIYFFNRYPNLTINDLEGWHFWESYNSKF